MPKTAKPKKTCRLVFVTVSRREYQDYPVAYQSGPLVVCCIKDRDSRYPYRVTHAATGRRLVSCSKPKDAKQVAAYLTDNARLAWKFRADDDGAAWVKETEEYKRMAALPKTWLDHWEEPNLCS